MRRFVEFLHIHFYFFRGLYENIDKKNDLYECQTLCFSILRKEAAMFSFILSISSIRDCNETPFMYFKKSKHLNITMHLTFYSTFPITVQHYTDREREAMTNQWPTWKDTQYFTKCFSTTHGVISMY